VWKYRKECFFVKTSKIRGISPPGRAGGRGKKQKQRAGRGQKQAIFRYAKKHYYLIDFFVL
jgi:hypothetical protein